MLCNPDPNPNPNLNPNPGQNREMLCNALISALEEGTPPMLPSYHPLPTARGRHA